VFILQGKEARAEIKEQNEIDSVLNKLQADGYTTVLRSMVRSACESVGLPKDTLKVDSLLSEPRFYRRPPRREGPIGDILHLEDHLFLIYPQGKRLFVWEIRHHSAASQIDAFIENIEAAIKLRIDGRRVRGMSFNWKDAKSPTRRRFLRSGRFQSEKLTTKVPNYTNDQLQQSKAIISRQHRDFLLNLAQLGKARSVDTASISNEAITKPLLDNSLVRKEYLVICRQDSRTLCTVPDKRKLESANGNYLQCTTCGRDFKDELIQEIYALTDACKELISGSHWMTIWVTDLLTSAGIPRENIKWNAAAGDDELDIVADIQGMAVFFELKDREFGLGDAYPFGFRVERYGGDVGVVLTMDKVANEAKKFFEEQANRRSGRIETAEGKQTIEKDLPKLIEQISRNSVEIFFRELSEELGVGILPLAQKWLQKNR